MKNTLQFYEFDFLSTLFPMETCRFLITKGEPEIKKHIAQCLSEKEGDKPYQFLAQSRVYASKPRNHLRRTVKLDPVSDYFLYEIIYRNRTKFRAPFHEEKKHFGYRFVKGSPIPPTDSYSGFKKAHASYNAKYRNSLSFDIASYFNGLYHHDIVAWFAYIGASGKDAASLGTYLRQSNSGRSIDCWPQGLYPAKMVGNDLIRFVEQHHSLKSSAIIRFMDDIVLFSNEESVLYEDFYTIQKLLGQKGLSVNPSKTVLGASHSVKVEQELDDVKADLLSKRRKIANLIYLDNFDAASEEISLSEEEADYLQNLLKSPHLEEEDAELILSLYRDSPEVVKPYIGQFAVSYPHLAKNVWSFCRYLDDNDFIGEFLLDAAKQENLQEYQLFWFAWVLQDYAISTKFASAIIASLYEHKNATIISRAKILEIPDIRYGLTELRDEHLVAGRSDWLSWASAVGHRRLAPIARNHKLEYFGNSSIINHLIKTIVTASK